MLVGRDSSTTVYTQTKPRNPKLDFVLKWLNYILSAATSFTFAFFAFGIPDNYDKPEYWSNLLASPFRLAFSSFGALSNFFISTYSHITNIPDAFKMIWERMLSKEHWMKHWYINLPVLFFSLMGSIAAGAVGFAAIAHLTYLGIGWAYFNAIASSFIFAVTRVFGLFKLADKITRFRNNQHMAAEKLAVLKEDIDVKRKNGEKMTINAYIKHYTEKRELESLDEKAVVEILKKVIVSIAEDKQCYDQQAVVRNKQSSAYSTVDITMAIIGAICALDVAFIFGNRFGTGCDQLIGFHPNRWLNLLLASSSSILYFNQAITLKENFEPARAALNNPNVPEAEKQRIRRWLAAFAVTNIGAARSNFNLAWSTFTNPTYAYPEPVFGPGTLDNPSSSTLAGASVAYVGVGILNTNFTLIQGNKDLLKPRVSDNSSNLTLTATAGPRFTIKDVITYLKTGTPLSSKAREDLDDYARQQTGSNIDAIRLGLFSNSHRESKQEFPGQARTLSPQGTSGAYPRLD